MTKEKIVYCRITEEEFKFLLKQAKNTKNHKNKKGNLNFSSFLREKLLFDNRNVIKKNNELQLKDLTFQVRKIGNNINQVTKQINAGFGNPKMIPELNSRLDKIYDLVEKYLEVWYGNYAYEAYERSDCWC